MAVADNQSRQNRVENHLANLIARVRSFIDGSADECFERIALDVYSFQAQYNQAYGAYCKAVTEEKIEDYRQVPAVVTSAFKEFEFTVLPPRSRETWFHSSGTTQQRPSRNFHSAATLELYRQSAIAGYQAALNQASPRSEYLILAPPAADVPHSSLADMLSVVSRKFGTRTSHAGVLEPNGSWGIAAEVVHQFFERINSNQQPVTICGTAFSFVHLCDYLADAKIRFAAPPGSKVFETGGYKGRSRVVPKSELHEWINTLLGVPESHIISEYGMSELASQAYDRSPGSAAPRIYRFPRWARAEVISPESGRPVADGERGLLRVFDLANVSSVLAIQTEDIAIRRGDGFELLGRAAEAEARGCSLMQAA